MNNPTITKNFYMPQSCPAGNVLYRITFKYKSNFSGKKLFNLTRTNFPEFTIDIPNRPLKPGDYVRYTPKNKNDRNHGKIAMITAENNKRQYNHIVKTYDLEFISPTSVENKVMRNLEFIPQERAGHTLLTLIPQLGMFICSSPIVPINVIKSYLDAYKTYNSQKSNGSLRELRRRGADLFDEHFKLGNNNEPLYPEFVARGHVNFGIQQEMKKKINRQIEKIVNGSFLQKTKSQKPKIKTSGNKKTLEFLVPRDFKSGKMIREEIDGRSIGGRLITVNVDGKDVNVRVPIGIKALDKISVDIEKKYNESIYDSLKPTSKTSKKNGGMTFFPTFIISKFSNKKQLDIHKLVKPSQDQSFKIKDASIIKQKDGLNFKFKELPRFNKKNNPLVFDLEVHIDFRLEVTKSHDPEEKTSDRIFGKIGDMIQNSGNDCPRKMRKLKSYMGDVSKEIEKTRFTPAERGVRTRRKRKDQRQIGQRALTLKKSKINRNRGRGKIRKYGGRRKKGGDYSKLAKKVMIKNASKYPKRYHARFSHINPQELLKKKQTKKVHPSSYPGKVGGYKKKRKTRRKKKTRRKTRRIKK